jgi:hypothetical protein
MALDVDDQEAERHQLAEHRAPLLAFGCHGSSYTARQEIRALSSFRSLTCCGIAPLAAVLGSGLMALRAL